MRALEMTPARAMKAVLILREALAAVDSGELPVGSLEFILRHEIWLHELEQSDLDAALIEARLLPPSGNSVQK